MEQSQEEQGIEVEQPHLQGAGTPFYQPTIMPSEKSDLYDKINPQDVVEQIKYRLMGLEYDRQEMKWARPKFFNPKTGKTEELMKGISEFGANEITTLMLPVSSKQAIISILDDGEIRYRTRMIVKRAVITCVQNWKEFGITSGNQIGYIKEIVQSNTFIALKQAQNAGAREFLGKSSTENKSIVEDGNKTGIAGMFRR